MKYSTTTAVSKILAMKKRLRIIQGGTSAGKTIAILLILIDRAQSSKNTLISVVSESLPHLKRGAIRDFLSIMEAHGYYVDSRWNKTDSIYTFETGSKIEFFGADAPDKVRGPRRNILFINECNNVSLDTYTQLAIRTKEEIYLDYNPVSEFWVHTDVIPAQDHDFTILTYKDNEGLPPSIVAEIESRKDNPYFWKVYGLGQLGEIIGKIYNGWDTNLEAIPHEAKLERYGLDFGYTNDPTSIVAIYRYNGGFILDEITFQRGLQNKPIADILLNVEPALVIGDSAEPKSVDEIRSYGVNIIGVSKRNGGTKTQTFKKWSIGIVQQQRISVTKRSTNIIKEYRNYLWLTDRDGHVLNEPAHLFSHSMDAIRYGILSLVTPWETKFDYVEPEEEKPRYADIGI